MLPMPAENEVNVSDLTEAERIKVEEAVEAVVTRNVERVRMLMPPDRPDHAETFWMWADNYGSSGRLDLSKPPGPIEEWTISGISTNDGNLALDVPMWASVGPTDLTLQLLVIRHQTDEPWVELQDMHVL
jgi:hypothetical protein